MASIAIESAEAPGVLELLQASDDFHNELYPPEEVFLLDTSALQQPGVTVVVARVDGVAVGMGALVEKSDFAEIKRMFVLPTARGGGLANGILQSLESVAREHGVAELKLETGPLQPEAISLYRRNGYSEIPLFNEYKGSASSVCFGKTLPR